MTTRIEHTAEQVTAPAADEVGPVRGNGFRTATSWALRVASLVVAVLLWHVLTAYDVRVWLQFDKLPGPVEVYQAFVRELGSPVYYIDVLQSLVRILSGFAMRRCPASRSEC